MADIRVAVIKGLQYEGLDGLTFMPGPFPLGIQNTVTSAFPRAPLFQAVLMVFGVELNEFRLID
jgi:hypothetical protein